MTKHASKKREKLYMTVAVIGCAILGSALGVALSYGLMALGVNL